MPHKFTSSCCWVIAYNHQAARSLGGRESYPDPAWPRKWSVTSLLQVLDQTHIPIPIDLKSLQSPKTLKTLTRLDVQPRLPESREAAALHQGARLVADAQFRHGLV